MSRRLQIPGEREEAALVAACEHALSRAGAAVPREDWPEPGSYIAANRALLGLKTSQADLDALWALQGRDGGFPAYWGGPEQADTSATVWAAMRVSNVDGERVSRLAAAVKAMGGVGALAQETKVEWALLGLIPADRVAESTRGASVMHGMERRGGVTHEIDLRRDWRPGPCVDTRRERAKSVVGANGRGSSAAEGALAEPG